MGIEIDAIRICHYCSSKIYFQMGYPKCSGDNIYELRKVFDNILATEQTAPAIFQAHLENLQSIDESFDIFLSYWRRKQRDPTASLKCPHDEENHMSINQRKTMVAEGIEMPKAYIPFPDLVEVYIAEIMLDRPLTDMEKEGNRYIPKISDDGYTYFAPLTWTTYPHGYMTPKDMNLKRVDNEPLPKIFDIDEIRGSCKGRNGNIYDD